jgi:ribosomal protein S12 methylthiotransferase
MSRVNIVTLGCSKNLVDSEYLSSQLQNNGFQVEHEAGTPARITIINTCGFINDAKQESIETILEHARQKEQGHISRLYVMGCLSQRYRDELAREIPEVDGFFGVYEQPRIIAALRGRFVESLRHHRHLATPHHYAYLKVAEGCNRSCSFCSIPLIKGNYKSKPIEELQKEASFLAKQGVRELNLIAQDLSCYGQDYYKKKMLPQLLKSLEGLDAFEWIRLLYAYPAGFPSGVLDLMQQSSSICHYLDIPLQHISDRMLKRMRRGHNRQHAEKLIELIRSKIPGITLRTTLLVGHPGESEKDFLELLEFVRQARFDRLGVFTYSEEEGTHSADSYRDDLPAYVKRERADELMKLQQEISLRKNQHRLGSRMKVLIDEVGDGYAYGRTQGDAPEVDNGVVIALDDQTGVKPGLFYEASITGAAEYDLHARLNDFTSV